MLVVGAQETLRPLDSHNSQGLITFYGDTGDARLPTLALVKIIDPRPLLPLGLLSYSRQRYSHHIGG